MGVPIGEPHCVAIIDKAVGKRVIKYCPKAILMLAASRCGGQLLFWMVKERGQCGSIDHATVAVDLILPAEYPRCEEAEQ